MQLPSTWENKTGPSLENALQNTTKYKAKQLETYHDVKKGSLNVIMYYLRCKTFNNVASTDQLQKAINTVKSTHGEHWEVKNNWIKAYHHAYEPHQASQKEIKSDKKAEETAHNRHPVVTAHSNINIFIVEVASICKRRIQDKRVHQDSKTAEYNDGALKSHGWAALELTEIIWGGLTVAVKLTCTSSTTCEENLSSIPNLPFWETHFETEVLMSIYAE